MFAGCTEKYLCFECGLVWSVRQFCWSDLSSAIECSFYLCWACCQYRWFAIYICVLNMHFLFVILHWACCQYRWLYIFAVLKVNWWFQYQLGILCTATWKCRWAYWKMCRDISLNLLVTPDIFIVYFLVTWILFCVIIRISVYLLFNQVLCLHFCPLCFVLELCIWYWKM